jgi:hypothetical protein
MEFYDVFASYTMENNNSTVQIVFDLHEVPQNKRQLIRKEIERRMSKGESSKTDQEHVFKIEMHPMFASRYNIGRDFSIHSDDAQCVRLKWIHAEEACGSCCWSFFCGWCLC